MEKTWSVSQLNQTIKKWLEAEFAQIWIEGEISNFKKYPSGHMYFSLKDDNAQASCVMFAGYNRHLKFIPKSGLQIKLKAKVSLYPDRGQFQLIVDYMEESGDGALKRAFELLKQKLKTEGLFDTKHKQDLPEMPTRIGIVTSAKGAAIRDILTTLNRRFSSIPVIIYPALVQGNTAPTAIVSAIEKANARQECDVLIVGRGGGSLEDLQAFNEEAVARAIFASTIPVVSAVGHEIDFTIADLVADVRAPTPTAAAEIVSPSQDEIESSLMQIAKDLYDVIAEKIEDYRNELIWLRKALKDPRQQLLDKMQRMDVMNHRLLFAMKHCQKNHRHHLAKILQQILGLTPLHKIKQLQQKTGNSEQQFSQAIQFQLKTLQQKLLTNVQLLETLSPLQTLTRGYAIVKDDEGKIISKRTQLQIGDQVTLQLTDGEALSEIKEIS